MRRGLTLSLGGGDKMYSPLVSVIVPIYNVAPYLRECLDSIISQTYKNLQIILINDGSTDESENIAKEYLRDNRVELISIENRGLSGARNLGLDRSRGEYIYFIDSDDYIDLEFLEEMVKVIQEFDVELICNEQIVYCWSGGSENLKQIKPPILLTPNSQNIAIGGSVWRCLFKKSLIDRSEVRFIERKIHEDEGFLYMIFPFCQVFVLYCGRPYYYRQREDSIMSNHKKIRSYDLLDIFEAIYLFWQKKGFLKNFEPPYYFLYNCALGYKNEKEYLKKAKELSKRLGFNFNNPPFLLRIYKKIKNFLKRLMIR